MASINLIEAFKEFKDAEKIDRPTLMKVLEDMFRTLIKKKYGSDDNFDIIVNAEQGDLEIMHRRLIVEDNEFEDPTAQIKFSDAIKIEPDYQLGEEIYEDVLIADFGRRAIMAAKQTLAGKLNEVKKSILVKKYKDRVGEILTAEVYQIWKKELLLIDEEGNELLLPKNEQIPKDMFRKGDIVKAILKKADFKNITPIIILSRTHPNFLAKLLELEVPEIFDGIITIKKIVREPGERAKVVVESSDDRIDPIGACVGIKGSRIHGIVRELRGESIDVINWTDNLALLIQRSLNPIQITDLNINDVKKTADIYVNQEDISKVIGKKGSNIKLTCKLTGYEIDVFNNSDIINENEINYDLKLEEFSDEIEEWVIAELKKIGCDTARSVLGLTPEELERRTDLEKETVAEVIQILQNELDLDKEAE